MSDEKQQILLSKHSLEISPGTFLLGRCPNTLCLKKKNKEIVMSSSTKIYPLRLAIDDYNKMMRDAVVAGLTASDYLKKLINCQEIKPKPPDSFKELAWEISKIGNCIDQLVRSTEVKEAVKEDIATANFLIEKIIELMREMG